jgi:hypothetical protein
MEPTTDDYHWEQDTAEKCASLTSTSGGRVSDTTASLHLFDMRQAAAEEGCHWILHAQTGMLESEQGPLA